MPEKIADKIIAQEEIAPLLDHWRATPANIVFTNGCFDLLHYGHVHYLEEARALGSHLVVGLNSSASVGRLKGAHRPIKDEKSRI